MAKCIYEDKGSWRVIKLNRPEKLNVLDEELVDQFQYIIESGLSNESIKAFVVCGEGDKSFCAGGDVVSVIEGQKAGRPYDFFFQKEYKLDQMLHQCSKPVISMVHGITMGGGMGLLMGGDLKLAEKHTIFAMPEITIGFFPDVGASYFLNRIPKELKLFLGMTGARFSAENAKDWGLIDKVISRKDLFEMIENDLSFDEVRNAFSQSDDGNQEIPSLLRELREVLDFDSLDSFDTSLRGLKGKTHISDPILQALKIYEGGSPLSKLLTWEYFSQTSEISIKESFLLDIEMSHFVAENGDFHEGVRALLIDKDKKPKWKDGDLSEARERCAGKLQDILSKF